MAKGTHDYTQDPRNEGILVYVNGDLVPREQASVSVFDSGFVLGDGVWEGLRLHNGKLAFAKQHLDRLYEGARAIDMDMELSPETLQAEIMRTVEANGMETDVHIRLMVTRGIKATPYQDPRVTISAPTVVIIPEYKTPLAETLTQGVKLFTVHVRRGYPDVQDQTINSHSKHNCIQACIQAAKAGADEALMLDPHGFVATCNSTHFFIVRGDEVWTSTGDYCLLGVTRDNIIQLCRENNIPIHQKSFTLTQVYSADEAFVTGTFAGVAPVVETDGRGIGDGGRGPMTARLQDLYRQMLDRDCA